MNTPSEAQKISASQPDWTREQKSFFTWNPSRSLLASIRSYQKHGQSASIWSELQKKISLIRHHFWSIVTGADIPVTVEIGGGLLIPHPNGIVIHARAKIGPNCLIFQQVTIGTNNSKGPPVLGGHVDIGAGAKVVGDFTVGDHAMIGANAVVLSDVPAGKTAVGIPARIL